MEPSQVTAVIKVPPGSSGGVIAERSELTALRTSEDCVTPMGQPEIDAAPVCVECDALHPPGAIQSEELRKERDIAHGRSPRARGFRRRSLGHPQSPGQRRAKERGVEGAN
jgi:hypothetical protein